MFKKKTFLISLALLASNFLLPNQVRSGLEIDEEITSEKKEVNFEIKRNRFRYYFHITSRDFRNNDLNVLCRGETINLLSRDCSFGPSFINDQYRELLNTLAEEERDLEIDEELGYYEYGVSFVPKSFSLSFSIETLDSGYGKMIVTNSVSKDNSYFAESDSIKWPFGISYDDPKDKS